jgi:hypothetical protein
MNREDIATTLNSVAEDLYSLAYSVRRIKEALQEQDEG